MMALAASSGIDQDMAGLDLVLRRVLFLELVVGFLKALGGDALLDLTGQVELLNDALFGPLQPFGHLGVVLHIVLVAGFRHQLAVDDLVDHGGEDHLRRHLLNLRRQRCDRARNLGAPDFRTVDFRHDRIFTSGRSRSRCWLGLGQGGETDTAESQRDGSDAEELLRT